MRRVGAPPGAAEDAVRDEGENAMHARHTELPAITPPATARRRARIVLGLGLAALALAGGLAGGCARVRAAGGQPLPGYPPRPYPPYPYPCFPPCPPGIIVYPSGCATPIVPPPPEVTPAPLPPGGPTPPAPPPIPLASGGAPPVALQAPGIPTPTPGGAAQGLEYKVCPQKERDIPKVIQDMAMAEPWTIYGYGMKRNPNVPYHPLFNTYRRWLSTSNQNMPYSICNPAIWKAGCP